MVSVERDPLQRQVEGVRPGSPIAKPSDEKMKAEQLSIFQCGSALEQGIGNKIDLGLTKQRSFFDNNNASLQILANAFAEDQEDADGDERFEEQDPKQRDETKSLSFHVRSNLTTSSFRNNPNRSSFRGPSFSFSSLRISNQQNARTLSSLHKYNKVTGSFRNDGSIDDTAPRSNMARDAAQGEDSDDDGSLRSSLTDSESEKSDVSSESGDFELHNEA
mmetsp:Transcript_6255/g.18884  ORF Transcript_6255/g.18884 Transcript_6255/m.18884 type:complete len:219 (+) Transcript_6255:271-927(+)